MVLEKQKKRKKRKHYLAQSFWSLYKHKQSFALRFSGVLLSSLVRPSVMILASLVSCVMAALLLSLTAATSLALLYTGVGVIGFFISLQFASGHLKHVNSPSKELISHDMDILLFFQKNIADLKTLSKLS